jgi:hypothetical protein
MLNQADLEVGDNIVLPIKICSRCPSAVSPDEPFYITLCSSCLIPVSHEQGTCACGCGLPVTTDRFKCISCDKLMSRQCCHETNPTDGDSGGICSKTCAAQLSITNEGNFDFTQNIIKHTYIMIVSF